MMYLTLNNGMVIPQIGTGTNTYGKENKDFYGVINGDTKELISAFDLGYRHIDTAIYYRNESVIGDAVEAYPLDRSEFFITSKIPEKEEFSSTDTLVRKNIALSLKALQTDYIDLYLMHFPLESLEENLRVWRVLEEAVDKKQIRSIGVSNFNEEQLGYLLEHARIKPTVNQFLSYPGHEQSALIEYCQSHGVAAEAYQSLTKVTDEAKKILSDIGAKYDKKWNQVILNYQVNKSIIVIPKSHNPVNQASNIDIFDFELSEEDIERIKNI
ncbi:aldo/keto reductase [Mycoplasmatota bacterium]|nr:aldo/keto reductase [Mycoplasmatota bacterium]